MTSQRFLALALWVMALASWVMSLTPSLHNAAMQSESNGRDLGPDMLDLGLNETGFLRFHIAVPVLSASVDHATVHTFQYEPNTSRQYHSVSDNVLNAASESNYITVTKVNIRHSRDHLNSVTPTAPCGLLDCKNRPAPLPGRSHKRRLN